MLIQGQKEGEGMNMNCYICKELLKVAKNIAHQHFQWHADEWFIKQHYRRIETWQHEIQYVETIPLPKDLEFQRKALGSPNWRSPDLQYLRDNQVVLGDVIIWEHHAVLFKKAYIMHKILDQMPNHLQKSVVFYEPFEFLAKANKPKKIQKRMEWYTQNGIVGCSSYREVAEEMQRKVAGNPDLSFTFLPL
jgi:hypothetical protein